MPIGILTPALRERVGAPPRMMPLFAGTERHGARHLWRRHGPESATKPWKRLRWSDWLLVQRLLDEAAPTRQPNGRWTFRSGAWLRVQHRAVGLELVAERLGDYLTPVTYYRVEVPRR